MPLTFNESSHTYTLDGVALPNVTNIIGDMGLTPQEFYPTGPYRTLGKMVHKACCLVDDGTVDQFDLGPKIAGSVESYKRLDQDLQFDWDHMERPNYDPQLFVAGTPDRVGKNRRTRKRAIVDFKTGAPGAWVRLQLAAYTRMEWPDDPGCWSEVERIAVFLDKEGGPPKVSLFTGLKYAIDFDGWRGVVDLWKWERSTK